MSSKLTSNDIQKTVKDILRYKKKSKKSLVEFEEQMKEEYPHFAEFYPEIFKSVVQGSLDMTMFNYMISMLRQMEKGKINERNASIAVGQVLVDKYVKPLVDDDEKA